MPAQASLSDPFVVAFGLSRLSLWVRVTQQIESVMKKRWFPVTLFSNGRLTINAVGIDISKRKRMVVVMRPFGEVVFSPFEVSHTDKDLTYLARR